jgi:hypothetical protein
VNNLQAAMLSSLGVTANPTKVVSKMTESTEHRAPSTKHQKAQTHLNDRSSRR